MTDAAGVVKVLIPQLEVGLLDKLLAVSTESQHLFEVIETDAVSPHALAYHVTMRQPGIVVFHADWLHEFGLDWLGEIQVAGATPKLIAFSKDLSAAALAHAIPLGLRGLLDATASTDVILRALQAVDSSELWISRRKILEVVHILSAGVRATTDIWDKLPLLTEREHSVLTRVLEGDCNKDIAHGLGISEQTVKIHLQHIYQKLGVHRRTDLLLSRP